MAMEGQPVIKELHPDCSVIWLGKRYGVSDPTDPEEVGEFWLTKVTDAHGVEARLMNVSTEAYNLGVRLIKEMPVEKIKALPYVTVTGESD